MFKTLAPLGAVAALALALSAQPSEARDHHHHHGRGHGHHHEHGRGHHRHGGGWHGGYGGGWNGHGPHGAYWRRRGGPIIIGGVGPAYNGWRGPRRVYVGGFGPGCSTARRVTWTPWGLRKVVTTKTCYVP